MSSQTTSLRAHLMALLGPLGIWVILYFFILPEETRSELFTNGGTPFIMGIIPGMSFGYLVCLLKLTPRKQPKATTPPPAEDLTRWREER